MASTEDGSPNLNGGEAAAVVYSGE